MNFHCTNAAAEEIGREENDRIICPHGHTCHQHQYGAERVDTAMVVCKECFTQLNSTDGFKCPICSYNLCLSCSAPVRKLATSRLYPLFCLDLPAFIACSNVVAMSTFRRVLRCSRLAAHPAPSLLPSTLLYVSSGSSIRPMQMTARARVRIHSAGIAVAILSRLLLSSQIIVVRQRCAFASSILRRLSGNGCSILRVRSTSSPLPPSPFLSNSRREASHSFQMAASDYIERAKPDSGCLSLRDALAADDVLACCAHVHSRHFGHLEQRDPQR